MTKTDYDAASASCARAFFAARSRLMPGHHLLDAFPQVRSGLLTTSYGEHSAVMSANMKALRTIRYVSLAAGMMAMLGALPATAAPKKAVPALDRVTTAKAITLPARGKAGSAVQGVLNPKALEASAVEFTLADGQKITADLTRVVRDDNKAIRSWVGTFADSPGSFVSLSKVQGVVTGFGTYQDRTFEVLPDGRGKHTLFMVDGKRLPQAADTFEKSTVGGAELFSSVGLDDSGSVSTTAAAAGAVVHDVLLVYTSNSAARWGSATLQSMIQNAVQAANQAYINSYANITVNVVGIKQVAMRESGSGMYGTMPTLEKDSEVQGLRKTLGADMVVLVSEDADYCGYAKLTKYFTNGVTTWWDANAIVYSNCLSNQTVAHELGHLQGLDHNRENTAYSGWYSYSYGYRQCTTNGFLDIMSYPCSVGVPKINVFSNPSVTYNGYATGVANVADTARTLNETATTVAGYMASVSAPTLPAAPSGLAVSSSTYNSVSLSWLDNATNESGYKVERSSDGASFTEIATLGAGTRSFADASVSSSSRYFYRVRAYNSAGVSGYSNTVDVTTASAATLPASPSGLAVTGATYNSVALAWWDNASNESGYKVERSVDGVTFGEIANLGAGAAGYTDNAVSASSNYFYRVRAYNSVGASSYSNTVNVITATAPAAVAVPSAPTSVLASNGGNGTALVTWTADATGVTSFQIRREIYDSRKNVWKNSTIAGTVPSTVMSMVDTTNNGTFRYFVSAMNSAGNSSERGPAQVTVSGGSGNKGRPVRR